MDITILRVPIPLTIYQELRIKSGLSAKTTQAAEIGLKNTLFSVLAVNHHEEFIGMGRVIGDGGCFCQVTDICILPEYQGQGIGKRIMAEIRDYINMELPESCYVSLIADGNANHLYEKYGFKDTLPASRGMYLQR